MERILFFIFILTVLLGSSCNIEKHIPEDRYFLDKVKLNGAPLEQYENLYNLQQQKPNPKTLGIVRLRMWQNITFNLKEKNEKKIKKKEEKIEALEDQRDGMDDASKEAKKMDKKIDRQEDKVENLRHKNIEDPVLLDSALVKNTIQQMESYLFNEGYFHSDVTFEVKTKGRKATVVYTVDEKESFVIDEIDYHIHDSLIEKLVMADTANRVFKSGDRYDGDKLAEERDRLALHFRENGYFNFSRQYILFEVDSTMMGDSVNVGIAISEPANRPTHRLYKVGKVVVEPEYVLGDETVKDSFVYEDLIFISTALTIKPKVIADYIFFHQGQLYKASDYQSTLNRLAQLSLYKFIDIQFRPDTVGQRDTGVLNVYIRLTPLQRREIRTDLELNSTEQDIGQVSSSPRLAGTAASVVYRDKNLFKSAIQLEIRPRGAIEVPIKVFEDKRFLDSPSYEYGISTALIFPRLLAPKKWLPPQLLDRTLKLNSQTSFNIGYLRDFTNFFDRHTFNTNLTYQINNKRNWRWFITPMEINRIYADFRSPAFEQRIKSSGDPLLINLYDPHLITDVRASVLMNQVPFSLVKEPHWVLRIGMDAGGHLMGLADRWLGLGEPGPNLTRQIFGTNYFQYLKSDVDFRFYFPIFKTNIAFRTIIGAGVPYGNSSILPFEKRFFVGGSTSMRAWRLRELGPGSYDGSNDKVNFDRSGDL
ncbi:MAG: BamA/TamA family outer membrane protein, partial [Bacteroidota bacterium]|nr:BamA/TamA family outer membrane protein [Bacteroidota bacterium]